MRLGRVLGKVIDERQSTFVGGRFMLDGVMVANEVVDEVKKREETVGSSGLGIIKKGGRG